LLDNDLDDEIFNRDEQVERPASIMVAEGINIAEFDLEMQKDGG